MECDIFPFSALTRLGDRKGIRPLKELGVGLLVVMIWLELCTTYSSSCHHHFHHRLLKQTMMEVVVTTANPGLPGKWLLIWREAVEIVTYLCWYSLIISAVDDRKHLMQSGQWICQKWLMNFGEVFCVFPVLCDMEELINFLEWSLIFPFSALTLLVGHLACKKLGAGMLVVTIWLELCTSYSPVRAPGL